MWFITSLLLLDSIASVVLESSISGPCKLRTELWPADEEALSVPVSDIRLAWQNLAGDELGKEVIQTHYQVELSEERKVIWNSGQKAGTEQMVTTTPAGSLKSGSSYSWRVQTCLNSTMGSITRWSDIASFSTAPSDDLWKGATWIGGHNQLRTELNLPQGKVKSAFAYVSGFGTFYLYINGRRVQKDGETRAFDPPQTVYPRRVIFVTHNVTEFLKPGTNVIGSVLGNYKWGYTDIWCNMTTAGGPDGCRAFILALVVTMDDGSQIMYKSDPKTWKMRQGPVVWDHLFHGETYDARKELSGWSTLPLESFADDDWQPATNMSHRIPPPSQWIGVDPIGKLVPMNGMPPIRATETFPALSISQLNRGRWIFDFGQNVAGYATLSIPANHGIAVGTEIKIEHAEILHDAPGDIYNTYCHLKPTVSDLRHEPCRPHQSYPHNHGHETPDRYIGDFNNANQTNIYIIGSNNAISYTPFFAAVGFRYAALSGLPESFKVTKSMLTSYFMHTDVRSVGNLNLANVPAEGNGTKATPDILNRIHHMVRYSQLSNLWSVPTDCPQRERRGWMGDAQVSSFEAMLNFEMQAFYENFFTAIRNDQLWGCEQRNNCGGQSAAKSQGSVADVVPFDGIGGWPGCPVWQVAYIVIMRNYWAHYADLTPLVEHYPGLSALMEHFQRNVDPKSGLLNRACYGDWVCVAPTNNCPRTPAGSVTAFYYVQSLEYMSDIAEIIGKHDEAVSWASKHKLALTNYHKAYYNETVKGYSPVDTEPRGSQTSNSMALILGAPPDAKTRNDVVDALVKNIVANDNHLTFGIVGSATLFPALSEGGRGDAALSILLTDTFPGYGAMVQQNMTTMCESWWCQFHDAVRGSQNHIMYGAFDAWMIMALGGLKPTSNVTSSGWRHFEVHPDPHAVLKLKSGSYSVDTRLGMAAVSWTYNGLEMMANVTVPVGSTATVIHDLFLGECKLTAVLNSNLFLWSSDGSELTPPMTVVGSGFHKFRRLYSCGIL